MFQHFMVFIYILSSLLGIAGVVLLLLLSKKKAVEEADQHLRLQEFIVNSFYLGLLSFFIFYKEYIILIQSAYTGFRLIDYLLWTVFIFYWVSYLDSLLNDSLLHLLRNLVACAGITFMVIWFFTTTIITDHYFYFTYQNVRNFLMAIFGLFFFLALLTNIISIWKSKSKIENLFSYEYVVSISSLMLIYSIWEACQYFKLYSGIYSPKAWMLYPINATPFVLFFINMVTIVYVYHHDAIPKFFQNEVGKSKPTTITFENSIDQLAKDYHLTQREIEIVALIYKGFNNAEIAEELFISQNTVKHHIYNIFKKLNVKNRIELICMFQE